MDDLSIIIPLYNHENEVINCIESLLKAVDKNMKIIVIDDGSTDDGYKLVKNHYKNNEIVKIFHKENGGLCSARNYGMQKANSKYITFCDPDDSVDTNYNYRNLISKMEQDNCDYAVFNYKYNFIKNKQIIINSDFPKGTRTINEEEIKYLKASTLVGSINNVELPYFDGCQFTWSKIYKLSIIKENNLIFNSKVKFSEDSLFNFQYLSYVKKAYIIDMPLYNYSVYDTNATNSYKKDIFETYDEYHNKIKYLKNSNDEFDKEMYYARVFRNLTNSLKYNVFHSNNTSKHEKIGSVLKRYPYYNETIKKLHLKSISKKQKVLLILLKLRLYFLLKIVFKYNK